MDWGVTFTDVFCSYACVNKNPRGFQDDVRKQLIGCVVLTRYNNRTYRIDDIAFNQSPQSTFQMADGTSVSFSDYYRCHTPALFNEIKLYFILTFFNGLEFFSIIHTAALSEYSEWAAVQKAQSEARSIEGPLIYLAFALWNWYYVTVPTLQLTALPNEFECSPYTYLYSSNVIDDGMFVSLHQCDISPPKGLFIHGLVQS